MASCATQPLVDRAMLAQAELLRLLAQARQDKMTGSGCVRIEFNQGGITTVKVIIEKTAT